MERGTKRWQAPVREMEKGTEAKESARTQVAMQGAWRKHEWGNVRAERSLGPLAGRHSG